MPEACLNIKWDQLALKETADHFGWGHSRYGLEKARKYLREAVKRGLITQTGKLTGKAKKLLNKKA